VTFEIKNFQLDSGLRKVANIRIGLVDSSVKMAADYGQIRSRHCCHCSPVSRATPDRRHLDDVTTDYCDCNDVIASRCDVTRDVVLPTAFVRRRNERERQRVR